MSASDVKWKDPAVPRTVVQVIPVSKRDKTFLMLHRSKTVRSAADCWSFPSGLHEIGEDLGRSICREVYEELNLTVLAQDIELVGCYENIAGDEPGKEQYHWVILMYVAFVDSFDDIINNEPDKHDEVLMLPIARLQDDLPDDYMFHSTLAEWLKGNQFDIYAAIDSNLSFIHGI